MSCPCDMMQPENSEQSDVCIGHLWLFKDLSQKEYELLAENALRRQLKKGQFVFCQGDESVELFLLKSGRVKLTKVLEDGAEITLDIRKPGDFIGETMLSEKIDYPVNAICMEDTLTCGFSKALFENIILEHPNIGLQVIRNMSERISQLTERVGSMANSSIEEKLLSVLRLIATRHGDAQDNGMMIQFPLTHEELGFLTGAHRVSITRAMKYLKESGKIQEQDKHLVVAEPLQ